jgi:hypothetical protein
LGHFNCPLLFCRFLKKLELSFWAESTIGEST